LRCISRSSGRSLVPFVSRLLAVAAVLVARREDILRTAVVRLDAGLHLPRRVELHVVAARVPWRVVRGLSRSLRLLVERLSEALSLLLAIRHLASLRHSGGLARRAARLSCAGSYHSEALSNARGDVLRSPQMRAVRSTFRPSVAQCGGCVALLRTARRAIASIGEVTVERMEHVGIVVDDLAAAIAFFSELGLELQGTTAAEGTWVDRVVGLEGVQVDVAILETPDGQGRIELAAFRAPRYTGGEQRAPANAWGIRHVAFRIDDIEAVVERLRRHGGTLVGAIETYEDIYRLCYVRGPAGIIVELAERIG
jgi:catechol 2,3-dioxygenase-like lactoylglutathione lyase family enzyme